MPCSRCKKTNFSHQSIVPNAFKLRTTGGRSASPFSGADPPDDWPEMPDEWPKLLFEWPELPFKWPEMPFEWLELPENCKSDPSMEEALAGRKVK